MQHTAHCERVSEAFVQFWDENKYAGKDMKIFGQIAVPLSC